MAQVEPDTLNNALQPQVVAADTLDLPQDTVVARQPQGDIKTYINYSARDSIRFNVEDKVFYLFGQSKIVYGDITLEAERIDVNWNTNVITATGILDENGRIVGRPIFSEGEDRYVADTIQYNLKTRKGFIRNVVTQEGEGYIRGAKGFKDADNNMYFTEALYTTCNLEHPHFFIKANKLKVIPEDKVVTGPFNLYVADVPTPLGFFFGFFPIPKEKQSGVIFPTFGEDNSRGFYISQGGYYFSIKDYVGIQVLGDIYTNGTWRGSLGTTYKKRYSFNGNLNFNYGVVKEGFDEDGDRSTLFNVMWNHASAGKRNSRFTASVNASSNNYYRTISYNPTAIITGTFQSNIQHFKQFGSTPFSLTTSLRQTQNVQTGISEFWLPEVNFAMMRVYPFKRKTGSQNRWYEKINASYNLNTQVFLTNAPRVIAGNAIYDTLDLNFNSIDTLFERAQYGAVHRIPISTTIKPKKTFLRFFNINPTIDFSEFWYPERLTTLNANNDSIIVDRGFARASSYSFYTTANTWIYGNLTGQRIGWLRKAGFRGLRHAMNPSVEYRWKPAFEENPELFLEYQDPTTGLFQRRSRFETFRLGAPVAGKQSQVSFSLSNSLEMKLLTRDTANPIKKFALIDRFGFSSGYNFAGESFKFTPIALYANTRILGIFDIRYTGLLDPYAYRLDSAFVQGTGDDAKTIVRQTRIDSLAITEGQGLGSIRSDFSVGFNLNPQAFKRKVIPPGTSPDELAYINNNPNLYVDFTIPWNLNVNYIINIDKVGFAPVSVIQSISGNGNISLTENWKLTFQTGYDLVNKALTPTSISIIRDLHCWQMSASIIPFGTRQSYFFSINPKASLLQDLKLTKRNSTYFGQPVFN